MNSSLVKIILMLAGIMLILIVALDLGGAAGWLAYQFEIEV